MINWLISYPTAVDCPKIQLMIIIDILCDVFWLKKPYIMISSHDLRAYGSIDNVLWFCFTYYSSYDDPYGGYGYSDNYGGSSDMYGRSSNMYGGSEDIYGGLDDSYGGSYSDGGAGGSGGDLGGNDDDYASSDGDYSGWNSDYNGTNDKSNDTVVDNGGDFIQDNSRWVVWPNYICPALLKPQTFDKYVYCILPQHTFWLLPT